jgi:hypothetical protein
MKKDKSKKHIHRFNLCPKCRGSQIYEGYNGYDHKCECNGDKTCRCGAIKHEE